VLMTAVAVFMTATSQRVLSLPSEEGPGSCPQGPAETLGGGAISVRDWNHLAPRPVTLGT